MADTVLFRGAFIRSFEFDNGTDARSVRINVTADWTEKIQKAMGWAEVPVGYAKASLIGTLAGSNMILTPSKKEIAHQEFDIEIDEVSGFVVIPVLDKEGEVRARELRFTVKTSAKGAGAKIEAYCNKMGREAAQLKVSYVVQEVFADAETQAAVVD